MRKGINKYLAIGLGLNSISLTLIHSLDVPEFIRGFMLGLSITFMLLGSISVVGQKKLKAFKKRLIGIK